MWTYLSPEVYDPNSCPTVRSCTIQDDGCVASTNFPDNYPSGDTCAIHVEADNRRRACMQGCCELLIRCVGLLFLQSGFYCGRRPIEVVAFSTHHGELYINDVSYSGKNGPQGVVPGGSIFWSADAQQQSRCGPGSVVEVCAEAIVL